MSEERLKELLRQADRCAESHRSSPGGDLADIVRRRARSRHIRRISFSSAAAAVILVAIGVWTVVSMSNVRNARQIAALEAKVAELTAQMETSLRFVKELTQHEREHARRLQLERELAAIPDPLEEIARQDDRTAFVMVYQADKLYRELNLRGSAVKTYNRVIKLFPENRWAEVAKERLSQMSQSDSNNEI